jgi:predicted alpha/beta superfamily hydrolase
MNRIALLVLLAISIAAGCKPDRTKSADKNIIVGSIDSVYSDILKESRKIWVYLPSGADMSSVQTYPVVYLLDGDAHFYSVMSMIQQLSEVNMNMVLPQMILIGITNTDRTRDLTPTHILTDPDVTDSSFFRTSGGSENFTAFIEKELIPYVGKKYHASPYRILIGHSYGGLFCINTLVKHTDLFSAYIAIDPSLNWDQNKILNQARELLSDKDLAGKTFYLSIANQGYSDTDNKKDNSAAFELAEYLDSNRRNNLRFRWKYYMDDNHGSVPMISEYDGLRFILDFYNPRLPYTKFREPAYKVDSFLVAHYNTISNNMGYKVLPPESLMNWLGYLFIMEKQYDKSMKLFKINTENYPDSPNVYDSMGEILLLQGDTAGSVMNYERSLKLNPLNQNAANILRNLK